MTQELWDYISYALFLTSTMKFKNKKKTQSDRDTLRSGTYK